MAMVIGIHDIEHMSSTGPGGQTHVLSWEGYAVFLWVIVENHSRP